MGVERSLTATCVTIIYNNENNNIIIYMQPLHYAARTQMKFVENFSYCIK